jgi:hypothetical protein
MPKTTKFSVLVDRAVDRKALLFGHALTFLMLAILVELAGQAVQ